MKLGVMIEHGPQDWQIIQQQNGFGAIHAAGRWNYEEAANGVFARVVREESGEVVVPWKAATDTGEHGWEITLTGIPAGGLYRLETCLDCPTSEKEWAIRGDTVHYLGVGDLFVIAGQSNSAGYGKDTIFDAPELGVHLFANDNRWKLAVHPLNDSTGSVHEINREFSNSGNSPYLSFAKYLKREMHYPIGLIQTSLGGSPLSRWNPEETGDLYENMLEVIQAAGGAVKGILWYQGCSDTDEEAANTYFDRFASFVRHTREALNDPQLAFITVQLARYTAAISEMYHLGWDKVREAQRQAARRIAGVMVTSTLDFSLSDCIHVSALSNLALGERMAKLALEKIYGKTIGAESPDIVQATALDGERIRLQFAPIYDHLYCYEVEAARLALEVEDEAGRNPLKCYAMEGKDALVLELSRPIAGQAFVHHGRSSDPQGRSPVDFATHLPLLAFYRVKVK